VGGFGGPASVPAQIEEDRFDGPQYRLPGIDRLFQPRTTLKSQLNEVCRLQVGMDYNSLYQAASETLTGNDGAASGIFRVYTDWTLFGETDKSSGSLIFKAENRHRYSTAITPSQIGFEAGYLGIPGVLFNDNGGAVSNLYWEQFLLDGQAGFVIGFLEPDSFVDVLGYANPWTTFQNRDRGLSCSRRARSALRESTTAAERAPYLFTSAQ
jgi:porin